ncbi:MAG: hypothetical protein EU529_12660 [Promethearchaeota archaeon]|nr:MAG: hypothetical protein EU529_12660 [Candidatus Lokiarchaeota archaeon]
MASEEFILFIDLATDYIDKKFLIKEIKSFIENKNKYGNESSFGIVIFQEKENPITLYDSKDIDSIIKIIEEGWDNRPKSQSYIENGLFEILSYIFRKSTDINRIYRIIIFSDTPSNRSDEYHQAVYDLIIKSKKFSTFIDIIRVGEAEHYDDDVKIKVITSTTFGGTFYCDKNSFNYVLSSLVKSKQEFNVIKVEKEEVLEEDKSFYESLAADLISLDSEDENVCSVCQFELCPICGKESDEILKCYNCGAKYHSCCIAGYAISDNIGFKHIFHCPQCENLLKLDEDYVDSIYEKDFKDLDLQEIPPIEEVEVNNIVEEELVEEELIEEELIEEAIEYEDYSKIEQPPPFELFEAPEQEAFELFEAPEQEPFELFEAPEQEPFELFEAPEQEPTELFEVAEQEPTELFEVAEQEPTELFEVADFSPPIEIDLQKIPPPPPMKKIRIGGYFGTEVELKPEKKPIKIIEPEYKEEIKSITELRPPRKRDSVKLCKMCGMTVKNVNVCPNCGAKID